MINATIPECEAAAEEVRRFMRARGIWVEAMSKFLRRRNLEFSCRTLYRWLANPSKGGDRLKMLAVVLRILDHNEPATTSNGVEARAPNGVE